MSSAVSCSSRSSRSFIVHNMLDFLKRASPAAIPPHPIKCHTYGVRRQAKRDAALAPACVSKFGFFRKSLPTAMLELFSAPARTRIIPADFGTDPHRPGLFDRGGGFADDVTAFGRRLGRGRLGRRIGARGRAAKGAAGLVNCLFGNTAEEILEGHQ